MSTTIDGKTVLEMQPDFSKQVSIGAKNLALSVSDGESICDKVFNVRPKRSLQHTYQMLTESESTFLMDFWTSMSGQHKSFWALSWMQEVDQKFETFEGTNYVQAEDYGMADLQPGAMFVLDLDNPDTNLHISKIITVTVSEEGLATYELETAIPFATTPTRTMIGFVYPVRFDSSAISFVYTADTCETTLKFSEVIPRRFRPTSLVANTESIDLAMEVFGECIYLDEFTFSASFAGSCPEVVLVDAGAEGVELSTEIASSDITVHAPAYPETGTGSVSGVFGSFTFEYYTGSVYGPRPNSVFYAKITGGTPNTDENYSFNLSVWSVFKTCNINSAFPGGAYVDGKFDFNAGTSNFINKNGTSWTGNAEVNYQYPVET